MHLIGHGIGKLVYNHFSIWHQFLQAEITKNNISISVFSLVNHYLTHIGYMTRKVRNLWVYNTRSMERTIGRYLKLIEKLTAYYTQSKCTFSIDLRYTLETVKLAVRAWINNHVYDSEMYMQKRSEVHHRNHHVRFNAIYQNHNCWYVDSVLFYFAHCPFDDESCRQFLVLVSVMKKHSAAEYDSNIPIVIIDTNLVTQRLVVISLNDIQNKVGLIQSVECPMKYKVVTSYYIFNEDIKSTAGKLRYIKL
ncbi:hypothetical protein PHYBLDRAFT_164135 [Phycomyces blakesleeanus NRRL 1555(-)]|uniref:Uncharacterized protein n=1 Tax=Phycomyces blakesleeanus (strain ATCC 8743b / DSM 1359 / FGSC 10004 / NBRC 33097 / NRRL 1555) TaxID=763407 RepID=A0A162UZT5_PHYB8|nr:hypothetical protein PHYBLDRAFT_164135 [Phycomyces blakesleeanus NRRL 1555(-)]OAD79052.1 hypothetical protein PHYBLDRAFT_164135 [Phycomyces blakesleeanus NRRL 1555(-)]|eukprot:XP_018297092.1 hypothetical protein PHYBLDRAFT_164135 [Phycomyces blakesleeanus NRRL 1555(-)]